MTYALLISISVGTLGMAVLALLWRTAAAAYTAEAMLHSNTKKELLASTAATALSESARVTEQARAQAVVNQLKAEIEILEQNLSHDPADIRDRLVGLLGAAEGLLPRPAPDAGPGTFGTVPFGAPAKP